jgi:23S rRNA (cytidine2498-2'-O)-methyltransferase
MDKSLYLAPFKHEADLLKELAFKNIPVLEVRGRLVMAQGLRDDIIWAQCGWIGIKELPITSIKDGAKKLRDLARNWALFSCDHHRRAQLIQDELPHYPKRPLPFLSPRPNTPMGGWTLWEKDLILASENTTSLYPLGEMDFQEDHTNPPSRAYLKLWEFFTCHSPKLPLAHEHLLDMGACPGGWSWVLQSFGGEVTAVDKAPLDERIARMPRIKVFHESAFGLDPKLLAKVDWFFSDIICYPERLWELVMHWHESGVRNFVCTIKYQGETDFITTQKFLDTLGGKVIHLHHNKHEVTWFLLENKT